MIALIRTPADFDPELNWESMKRQQKKFDESPELEKALRVTTQELVKRHRDKETFRLFLLGVPDSEIENRIKKLGL